MTMTHDLPPVATGFPIADELLSARRAVIGADFDGYRGHVTRMLNFAHALHRCQGDDSEKLQTAAAFHDIGLWTDHTTDYLPPSIREALAHLERSSRSDWREEIARIIDLHHKLRAVRGDPSPLVEAFRRADLVDFSLGTIRQGLPRAYVRAVQQAIPNAGFHRFLMKGAAQWFAKHPLSPPPFLRW